MESGQIIGEITEIFRALSAIPHPSGHEEALARAVAERLRAMGGTVETDGVWNLRCDLPASPGLEDTPRVCVQGHLDMVCAVAPGSDYDPLRDGIRTRVEGGWLRSDGRSSLGADNLLANCAVLWLLGQNFPHGPVRLLLTTMEEQALGGARAMDPRWLEGVQFLINTDGFRGDRIIIGSAGGCRQHWRRTMRTVPAKDSAFRLTLSGFPGGHSGDDIAKGRVNPLRLLARLLAGTDTEVAALSGGTALNAIPAAATAVVVPRDPERLRRALDRVTEAGGRAVLEPLPGPAPEIWAPVDRQAALDFLLSLPHGLLAMNPDYPKVPACSANLGVVDRDGDTLSVRVFLRGTPQEALDRAAGGCALVADRCGFALEREVRYPPWGGTGHNPLAEAMSALWERRNGTPIEVTPVHVGLEPSRLLRGRPDLTAAVLGVTIRNAHSVRERAELASLPPFVRLLRDTLTHIARRKGDLSPC